MLERQSGDLGRPNEIQAAVNFPVLLAVDPSINNLGWAAFDFSQGNEPYDISNWQYGLIHPKGKHLQHKWKDAYLQLKEKLDKRPTHYATEWPMYLGGQKGMIAAQENYTINLAGITAFIAGRFQIRGEFISLWTPVQWKGSVPKHVTERKFLRLFGEGAKRVARTQSSDVIDAIMIAEFWIDLYLREKFSWMHHPEWVRRG